MFRLRQSRTQECLSGNRSDLSQQYAGPAADSVSRLAPGADPNAIRLIFRGAGKLALNERGDLIVNVGKSKLVEHGPAIYQESGGARRTIAGGWRLHGAHEAGLQVAAYDRTRPIVIDPVLTFSTYLGGSSADGALAVAADASSNAYVTGFACSTDFPVTSGVYQDTAQGGCDAFISKFNSSGALVYSTYLGGSSFDEGLGIAVDSTGATYVAGETYSSDFPTTAGQSFAVSCRHLGNKLNPAGSSLVFGRLFGGSTSTTNLQGQGGSHASSIATQRMQLELHRVRDGWNNYERFPCDGRPERPRLTPLMPSLVV